MSIPVRITGFSNKVVLGETSSTTPALASVGGKLFLVWRGFTDPDLSVRFSTDNGQTFADATKKISPESAADPAPAIVANNSDLLIAWKGAGNDRLSVGHFSDLFGGGVLPATRAIATGSQPPADQLDVFAVNGMGELYVFWESDNGPFAHGPMPGGVGLVAGGNIATMNDINLLMVFTIDPSGALVSFEISPGSN